MKRNAASTNDFPKDELIKLYRQAIKDGIPLEKIEKKVNQYSTRVLSSHQVEKKEADVYKKRWKNKTPFFVKLVSWVLPTGFLGIGLFLVGSAVVPIVFSLLASAPQLQASQIVSPIPSEQVLDVVPIVIAENYANSSSDSNQESGPEILDVELDYTNLANWFEQPQPELEAKSDQDTEEYYVLEIPKLRIENAKVVMGGTDLKKSLIQYPGTADPGDVGAPVIFGHSVLRQFYNPSEKNPNRYNSIFSTIMTLENGDKIFITYDDISYTYVVLNRTEVKPTDTFILAQRHDARLLKIVTCTPEGTFLRRGVVTAQLVE